MGEILDGKKVSSQILEKIRNEVKNLEKKPSLAVILVGDNPASKVYVNIKEKRAKECGFNSKVIKLESDTSADKLFKTIEELNNDKDVNAILLQLPLPKHLDSLDFVEKIDPKKDVDGFHPINVGKLSVGQEPYSKPCTPYGVIKLLKSYNIEISGKLTLVIGRSNIVGKPMSMMMLKENATVIMAHSKSANLKELSKKADIIISAVGKPKFITSDMVKDGVIIVDVGFSHDSEGKPSGDVDFENVKNKASYITPVPNGVGPMTIATLMENTLNLYKNQR